MPSLDTLNAIAQWPLHDAPQINAMIHVGFLVVIYIGIYAIVAAVKRKKP